MFYQYEKDFDTPYTSIDRSGYLGIVESMDINQDMITDFFGYIGSDNVILRKNDNAAWIYTRTKLHIEELPFWKTKTRARTFVSSKSPIRLELETHLQDQNGKLLFTAKTEMCAIDFIQRKIKKISEITFPKDLETGHSLMENAFTKLNSDFTEDDLNLSLKVFASDTDFTRHTNNTRYVKYIMDTMSADFYDSKKVKEFEIHFVKETTEGSLLKIYRKQPAAQIYNYLITSQDQQVVKAQLVYEDS